MIHNGRCKKRMRTGVLAMLILSMLCTGCAGQSQQAGTAEEVQTQEVTQQEESSVEETVTAQEEQEAEDTWYEHLLEESTLSVGTNGRLEQVLRKLEQGEEVTIALIGGSITEGAGASSTEKSYADQFIAGLQERYPDADITYCNAAIGGTSSALGMMRYDRDVTNRLEQDPDLVLIEFAVNDWDEPTTGRAYESMIRTVMQQENDAAVLLVFSVFRTQWNQQEVYVPMGNLYGLPMVSIKDAVKDAFAEGKLTDALFFSDEYHPTSYGHGIMANCLLYLIDTLAEQMQTQETEVQQMPTDWFMSPDFMGMHFLSQQGELAPQGEEADASVTPGGFSETDSQVQYSSRLNGAAFADNWQHTQESGTESFKVELNCRNILINYKASSLKEFGTAEVLIDGEVVTTLSGYDQGGWNNSKIALVLDEEEAAQHTLEIRMTQEDQDKRFTIQCIGYTRQRIVNITGLASLYQDNYPIGVALPNYVLQRKVQYGEVIRDNFNSITCENEMKPDSILDKKACQDGLPQTYEDPAVSFDNCQPAIVFALENDLKIRFHTLVWHSQTPKWFFTEDYTAEGELVSREVMLARMENYIETVLTYFDENYPELIYAVDVVNESFDVGNGDANGVRQKDNLWYETVGDDYFYQAFVFARKYAPSYMKLFYNDYGCMYKVDLILEQLERARQEGLIDGIGMQAHLSVTEDIQTKFVTAVKRLCDAGYDLQITELDIGVEEQTEEQFMKQGRKYKSLFRNLQKLQEEGYPITGITVWGLNDSLSWRGDACALLFDAQMNPKPAYEGAMLYDSIPDIE